jgi:hypothetical protein
MTKYRKSESIITDEMCSYGCGSVAKFKSPSGILMCCASSNSCPNNKAKNSAAIKKCYENGRNAKQIYANSSQASKDKMTWSKGLTKDVDERVARPCLIGRRFGASLHGHSIETKEKLSKIRISMLEKSPNVEWKLLPNGMKVQGSWEYNVGIRLLELGFTLSRYKITYDGHRRYTPDFCIGENIFVEVKGWLSDRDKDKYRRFFRDNDVKIYLIRNECGKGNYTKFIQNEITIFDCEDLKEVVGN